MSKKSGKVSLTSYIQTLNQKVQALEHMVSEMGLDVRASKKNRFPRKTQPVAMNNLHRALCVETIDPLKEGRVRFYHPILHHPQTPVKSLPFARAISAMGGFDDCGLVWVPPAGSTLCMFFENGDRDQPYYVGTMWHRNRGPAGNKLAFPVPEYQAVSSGHRRGYLVGPDDESQVLPQWNTENYNGKDYDSITEFIRDVDDQKRSTYPNIYGFKTPEKHMVKMVDGNAKCNRRWKRMELLSGCGNWMIFKDDHMHYGGQWAHPSCPPDPSGSDLALCSTHSGVLPYFTDFHGKPIEKNSNCTDPILGGHPSTPDLLQNGKTKYVKSQKGSNPYFKHKNECRPYRGPGTPQNNKCDLPQSGVQILSIGGHTMVFDDSVEEPRGKPEWERSLNPFDFGCNDKCVGRLYIKSMTGHKFEMSDVEELTKLRGKQNYIELRSAAGNWFQMNDHTEGTSDTPCPPNYAGQQRGIHMMSTSRHEINLCDWMNKQCGPPRAEGGVPTNNATEAYVQIKSGYGMEMRFQDEKSQRETQSQWIQITNPQCACPPEAGEQCPEIDTKCNRRGAHFLRFQARPNGQPGVIFLRAGGHAIRATYDKDIVLVGDKEKNPSDKFTYVSQMNVHATEKIDFRYAGDLHIMFAEEKILLLAGRDCPPKPPKKCCGPCVYPVLVGKCPVVCRYTGIVHYSVDSLSERVFASAKNENDPSCHGVCPPGGLPKPCKETEENIQIDTGAGIVTIQGESNGASGTDTANDSVNDTAQLSAGSSAAG